MHAPSLTLRTCVATALAGCALAAAAHDTWFEALPSKRAGEWRLALGTGDRFPVQEHGIDPKYIAARGCLGAVPGPVGTLRPRHTTATALVLTAPTAAGACWAQLQPFQITLTAGQVQAYLKELNAGPDLRATWAALQARGVAWKETYTKHARIQLGGVSPPSARPTGMPMDMLLQAQPGPLRVREPFVVQVLRAGRPLAGFKVELRSERSPQGLWLQTDADGHVTLQPPVAGRWVLRGTDLAPSPSRPDEWESRFITLAFDVAPALDAAALVQASTNLAP